MGNVFNSTKKEKEQNEQDMEKAKGDLNILYNTAVGKKQLYEDQLVSFYKDKANFGTYEMVGDRLMSETSVVTVSMKSGADKNITDGIEAGIDGLFGAGSSERNEKFHTCVHDLVLGAFDSVFGNTMSSETEMQKFFVIPYGYVVYRIDVFMWKMNVAVQSNMYSSAQSTTVAVCGMGIVDYKSMSMSEVIAMAQQVVGPEPSALINWAKDFANVIHTIESLGLTKESPTGTVKAAIELIELNELPEPAESAEPPNEIYKSGHDVPPMIDRGASSNMTSHAVMSSEWRKGIERAKSGQSVGNIDCGDKVSVNDAPSVSGTPSVSTVEAE